MEKPQSLTKDLKILTGSFALHSKVSQLVPWIFFCCLEEEEVRSPTNVVNKNFLRPLILYVALRLSVIAAEHVSHSGFGESYFHHCLLCWRTCELLRRPSLQKRKHFCLTVLSGSYSASNDLKCWGSFLLWAVYLRYPVDMVRSSWASLMGSALVHGSVLTGPEPKLGWWHALIASFYSLSTVSECYRLLWLLFYAHWWLCWRFWWVLYNLLWQRHAIDYAASLCPWCCRDSSRIHAD